MEQSWEVIVVGGGAAGLMAAGTAAENGRRVMLFDKNRLPGRKVRITGKGRCNLTNRCGLETLMENIPGNGKFLYSAFGQFSPADTMDFFKARGLKLKTERGNRVFPASDKAADVADALACFCRGAGVQIHLDETVRGLMLDDGQVCGVITGKGRYAAESVIVATGGKSYPLTGSTGDGYRFAQAAGHTIVPPVPSLVPLVIRESWCHKLQGLSLKNVILSVTQAESGKPVYEEMGEMLFTHFGVSGPLVLSASAHMKAMTPGKYQLHIDLKPALDEKQLDTRLLRDFEKYHNRDFCNALHDLLPQKLIPVVVSLSEIPPNKKVNQLSREDRKKVIGCLKCLTLTAERFRPIEEAIVTSGGVKVSEINPKTMESKLCHGLYFAGEVLDVDAYTGGFNLQIAFSTGYLAGQNA